MGVIKTWRQWRVLLLMGAYTGYVRSAVVPVTPLRSLIGPARAFAVTFGPLVW